MDISKLPYRQGVGLCVINREGLILCAERRDRTNAWQMPQGGIQKGEDLRVAALRELREEIGTDNVEIIGVVPEVLRYEFPDYLQYRGGIFRGKYKGQEQVWFALRYLGEDADINLDGAEDPEPAEFVSWKWLSLEESVTRIVDFKRPVYQKVLETFKPLAEAIREGRTPPEFEV